MERNGWVKFHRKLLDSVVFQNEKALKIWVWCLLRTNHKEAVVLIGRQKITIKPGQFLMGSNKESEFLNIAKTTLWRWLEFFEKEGMVELKKTTKYTIVTLPNWGDYQEERNSNGTQTSTQVGTNKNDKKEKKEIPAPEDGRRGTIPTFGGEEGVESAPRAPRPVKTPVSTVIEIWNKYPNWKATGNKATPKNPSVIKELLPPAKDVKALNGVILKKRSKYSEEDFDHAIRQYASEVANRNKDDKGYYQHRFTLYEFLTRHDIFERYVTR